MVNTGDTCGNKKEAKHRYYRDRLKNKKQYAVEKYKIYRNKLPNLIRTAQKNYYAERFEDVRNDSKRTWQLIKNVTDDNLGCSKTISVKELSCGSSTLMSTANKFNEYFTHIGPNLADKIPYISRSHLDYMKNTVSKSMFIKPTNVYEIKKIVSELHSDKSLGYDGFLAKVIKAISEFVCEPLSHICNLTFVTGCFPDRLKLAKVLPLHKSENKKMVSDYRPISTLPLFSKILEKLMHFRLYEFF